MRILLVKHLGSLRPVDEASDEALRRFGQGEIVAAELHKPRNLQFHRKFFAMLRLVYQNQEAYKSMDDLLDVLKLSIGHCRTVRTKHGDVQIPSSISFAAMDDIAFQDFYNRAVDWVCAEVIPGLRSRDLNEEVEAELMAFAGDH